MLGDCRHTRGDAVNTNVVLGPLSTQRLAKLDNTSLGGVVAGLLLGVVDNGSRHGGNQDNGSRLAGSHHGLADGLRDQEGSGQIDVDQASEHDMVIGLSGDV